MSSVNFIGSDIRYALRALAKRPLFAAVAIGSLALGIGANTAIFTLADQLLLRLLPVKAPEQLVLLWTRGPHYGSNTGSNAMSYPMYVDYRERNKVFSGIFARYGQPFSFSMEGKTERVSGELVTGNYFGVLGIGAAAGRVITASDDLHQGSHPVAVLSYDFWQTHFAGDPGVIGKKVLLNGYPMTVIGVSQKGFQGIDPSVSPQVRVPMTMKKEMTPGPWYQLSDRRSRFANVFARLRPGVTLEQAKASLQPIHHAILADEVKDTAFAKASDYTRQRFVKGWIDVLPASKGRSETRKQYANSLWVLMAITGFVLLIACANLANLLIARAAARQKEIAMRLAVGASRFRLVRQLLVECMLLSIIGGALGLMLAYVMDKGLISFLPQETTPLAISPVPDWRVFAFTAAVSVATSFFFGLVPALMATRPDLANTLKDQASAVGGGSATVRKFLVVAQVSLSVLLLVGSGLFVKTLNNLKETDPGFRIDRLLAFKIDPPSNGYKSDRSLRFYTDLQERLKSTPGVESASLAIVPMLEGDEWDSTITVEGYHPGRDENMSPHMNYVLPEIFQTLSVPVMLGRDFSVRDTKTAPKVAIVNERFAKKFFGGQNPVGRRIGMGGNPGTPTDMTIIGMVRDTKYEDMRTEIPIELYLSVTQIPFMTGMTAYVRTHNTPEQMMPTLRELVKSMDPNLPVYAMRTMREQVERSVSTESLVATLSSVFGLLATLLAAIGLYGVMAYTVSRRTREIGIRMALGADRNKVVWLVMREVMLLCGSGIVLGVAGAFLLARYVQSQLYGVAAQDPATVFAVIGAITLTALLSGWAPTRRATGVHPMEALRYE